MDMDTLLLVLRVSTGLVLAAHGAQKVFAWAGGPGIQGTTGMTRGLGFRPPELWARFLAWGELAGGLALAAGILTGLAAGVLFVDMLTAAWKVHYPKGFWNTNGGMEYTLVLAVVFAVVGMAGAGLWSLDQLIGTEDAAPTLFLATTVLGLLGVWGALRPEARRVTRPVEAGRRKAA